MSEQRSSNSLLRDWLEFSRDVQSSCAAGDDWLRSLRERTEIAIQSATDEPKALQMPPVFEGRLYDGAERVNQSQRWCRAADVEAILSTAEPPEAVCGACGDGCKDRDGCRLKEESPPVSQLDAPVWYSSEEASAWAAGVNYARLQKSTVSPPKAAPPRDHLKHWCICSECSAWRRQSGLQIETGLESEDYLDLRHD